LKNTGIVRGVIADEDAWIERLGWQLFQSRGQFIWRQFGRSPGAFDGFGQSRMVFDEVFRQNVLRLTWLF